MPDFSRPFKMQDVNLVAVFSKSAFEAPGATDPLAVNVQVDMTKYDREEIEMNATGRDRSCAWLARPQLAVQKFTDENGVEHKSHNVFYKREQVQSMLDAGREYACERMGKDLIYVPFKADVISKGNGNYVVNTDTIREPEPIRGNIYFNIGEQIGNSAYARECYESFNKDDSRRSVNVDAYDYDGGYCLARGLPESDFSME